MFSKSRAQNSEICIFRLLFRLWNALLDSRKKRIPLYFSRECLSVRSWYCSSCCRVYYFYGREEKESREEREKMHDFSPPYKRLQSEIFCKRDVSYAKMMGLSLLCMAQIFGWLMTQKRIQEWQRKKESEFIEKMFYLSSNRRTPILLCDKNSEARNLDATAATRTWDQEIMSGVMKVSFSEM